jgi:hypothetical protein
MPIAHVGAGVPLFMPINTRSQNRALLAAILFAGAASFGANAFARTTPTPAPSWAKGKRPKANESYLVQTTVQSKSTLNDEVFADPALARAMRTEYENSVDEQEALSRAGLLEQSQEKTRFAAMKAFAQRALNSFSQLRMKVEGDRLTKAAMNSNLPREPLAAVVLAASLYTGRSMKIKVFKDRPISSRIVLKDRAASMSMPLISGFTSSVAYNNDSKMSAQLSKQLAKNVSAVVDTTERGNAQVVYSVSF